MLKSMLRRLRRNHALEHATVNLVSQRYPGIQIVGFSDPLGFSLYTALSTEKIEPLVRDALASLKAGHRQLALHDNCGTNVVVTALLTTIATLLGFGKRTKRPLRRLVRRLPYAVLLNTMALFAAPSAAHWVQSNLTTDPHLENVEITGVNTDHKGGVRRIRVRTVHYQG
jgi:hypothetical protein